MIDVVNDSDIDEIRKLIAMAVKTSVVSCEEDAEVLMEDIDTSLDWWLLNKAESCHFKYVLDGKIVGVILIKDYRNLCNLFVHPDYYMQGIGRALFEAVAPLCREKRYVREIRPHCGSGFCEAICWVLLEAVVLSFREKKKVQEIKVNSSDYAAGFYEAIGFVQTGPAQDRLGGCVPYEYRLQ